MNRTTKAHSKLFFIIIPSAFHELIVLLNLGFSLNDIIAHITNFCHCKLVC